jgi:hypothetical protein
MQPLTDEVKHKLQNTSQELQMLFIENPKAQVMFYDLLAELNKQIDFKKDVHIIIYIITSR